MRVIENKPHPNRQIARKATNSETSGGKKDENYAIFKEQSHRLVARQRIDDFAYPNLSQLKPLLDGFLVVFGLFWDKIIYCGSKIVETTGVSTHKPQGRCGHTPRGGCNNYDLLK